MALRTVRTLSFDGQTIRGDETADLVIGSEFTLEAVDPCQDAAGLEHPFFFWNMLGQIYTGKRVTETTPGCPFVCRSQYGPPGGQDDGPTSVWFFATSLLDPDWSANPVKAVDPSTALSPNGIVVTNAQANVTAYHDFEISPSRVSSFRNWIVENRQRIVHQQPTADRARICGMSRQRIAH